jgi:putative membrane protein
MEAHTMMDGIRTVFRVPGQRFFPLEDVGNGPDYRLSLTNERTFLAWIRTALTLVAGGLAVATVLPEFTSAWGRKALGLALVALATFVAGSSFRR